MTGRIVLFIKFYNGTKDQLDKIFQNLEKLTLKPSKIVVVDDGSPDLDPQNNWINDLRYKYRDTLNLDYYRSRIYKAKPDLNTVGQSMFIAYSTEIYRGGRKYDYISWMDLDTLFTKYYFQNIIHTMENNPELVCASGGLCVPKYDMKGATPDEMIEELEKGYERLAPEWRVENINVGASFRRKDARGSGKVVRNSFLMDIKSSDFPAVGWDTWINTRAKIEGFKAKQLNDTFYVSTQPTTRVKNLNPHRNGELTYHFGYNPLLVLMKTVLSKRKALEFLRGYRKARQMKWKLPDKEVRKFFGWRFLLHPFR